MKKVYQTIVSNVNGNCTQASVASLFDLELEQVPNFIEMPENKWFWELIEFYKERGYSLTSFNINNHDLDNETKLKILEHDGGVNGYWLASVNSCTFKDSTHSVLVDKNLKVVHDPNPNQLALQLKPEDILEVSVVKEDWHIDIDGKFVIEK